MAKKKEKRKEITLTLGQSVHSVYQLQATRPMAYPERIPTYLQGSGVTFQVFRILGTHMRNWMKYFWFFSPTQLLIQGQ